MLGAPEVNKGNEGRRVGAGWICEDLCASVVEMGQEVRIMVTE